MDEPIGNTWLAELLDPRRDLVMEYWIQEIRAENIHAYGSITDEQLRADLPPTVDSMIHALQTGDAEGPRQHSVSVIQRRIMQGFQLLDLQMSLHALKSAVMRIVREADVGPQRELEALRSASSMYYQVALIAAAVYDHLRAEQRRRMATTYEFGILLSRNLDLEAMLDTAASRVAEYARADSVAILLAEPRGRSDKVRALYNVDAEVADHLPAICEAIGCGIAEDAVLDARQSICMEPDLRISERLISWSSVLVAGGHLSIICVPLIAKQEHLGSLVLMWPEVRVVPGSEEDFLLSLAAHIANAVQNARLYEEAKGKRELGMLLKASRLFASSLNTGDILRKLARMATEVFRADLAIVFTLDHLGERSGQMARYSRSRDARKSVRRIMEAVAPNGEKDWSAGLGESFARGKPLLFGKGQELPERLRSLVDVVGSALAVPLRKKDKLVGAFTLVSLRESAFTQDDLLLAMGLADLATVAIENARSYEYERKISETLQRSFLPPTLPDIEGYETAAYYRPAIAEAEIGGDFYDLFPTGKGEVSVVIGDVSGKGLGAAVPTAMGKYTIRAYASENPSPGSVLGRLNRVFYEASDESQFMTALHGRLDPKSNAFTYANAGHNPPLLYSSASGQVREVETGGICLGVSPDAAYEDKTVEMQPGDVLLLFTDGATDVRVEGKRLEVEGLEDLFRSSAQLPAKEIVQNVFDGVYSYGHGRLADDVALAVIKRELAS